MLPIFDLSEASQVLGVNDQERGDNRGVWWDCLDSCASQRNSSNIHLEQDGEVSKFRLCKFIGLERPNISISVLCSGWLNVQSEDILTVNSQQPLDVTTILLAF